MCQDCDNFSTQVNLPAAGIQGLTGQTGPQGPPGPAGVGIQGPAGADGTPGTDGTSFGVEYKFLGYSQSTPNPGASYLSFNGPSAGASSIVNVSQTDNTATDETLLLSLPTFIASTRKAILTIISKTTPNNFAVFDVRSSAAGAGFNTISVTNLAESANPLVSGETVTLMLALAGDKGDTGATGNPGAFIIGTIGGGNQAYPTTASRGNAWRFTAPGVISNSGAGAVSVEKFELNDILYCINDTVTSTGTNFIIFGGRDMFRPGAGTDSSVQNVGAYNAASAAGAGALAITGATSSASGANSLAGNGATSSGSGSVGYGSGITVAGVGALAIGANHASQGNYNNSLGYQHTLGASSAYNATDGYKSVVAASVQAASVIGQEAQATISGGLFQAAGKFSVAGDAQTIEFTMMESTNNGTFTDSCILKTSFANQTLYHLVMPNSSIWAMQWDVVGTTPAGTFVRWIGNQQFRCSNVGVVTSVGTVNPDLWLKHDGTWATAPVPRDYTTAGVGDMTMTLAISSPHVDITCSVAGPLVGTTARFVGRVSIVQSIYA